MAAGGGSGAVGITEGEARHEVDRTYGVQRFLKLLFRFAGKAYYYICRKRYIRHLAAKLFSKCHIRFGGVLSVHFFKNPVASGLHRQVKMTFCLRVFGYCFYKLVRNVLRMARHKSDNEVAVYFTYFAEQVGKVNSVLLSVRVYVLTQKRYFFISVAYKPLYFFYYFFGTTASLPAAYIRHYAVGTEIIAAVHYADPSGKIALSADGDFLAYYSVAGVFGKASFSGKHTSAKDFRKLPKRLRAEREVNVRIAVLYLFSHFRLRYHTSANTYFQRRIFRFQMLVASCHRECFLLCVISYSAGIYNYKIRLCGIIRKRVAHFLRHSGNSFAVSLVLLTAICNNATCTTLAAVAF